MDEIYVTYVDDEHVDNHDYDGMAANARKLKMATNFPKTNLGCTGWLKGPGAV